MRKARKNALFGRVAAVVLTLAMALSLMGFTWATPQFTDMDAAYPAARTAITKWYGYGVITGAGEFNPRGFIPHAEMAQMLDAIMGARVPGLNRSQANVTRQEAVIVLANVMGLYFDPDSEVPTHFLDDHLIARGARGAINTAVEARIISGFRVDGGYEFRPTQNIRRMDVAVLFSNAIESPISSTTAMRNYNRSVVVNRGDVTLRNVNVAGHMVIGAGVGEGVVTLENVTIEGFLIIRSNAEVQILDGTVARQVWVDIPEEEEVEDEPADVEEPEEPPEEPVVVATTLPLVDGEARFTLPQMGEHWLMISWPVGAVWPAESGLAGLFYYYSPADFTGFDYLQFDLLVEDLSAVPAGNDWRVRLVSGDNIDGANYLYSFWAQVQEMPNNSWYTISIPLAGDTVLANPAFDMSNVTGMRIFVEPDESHDFTVNAGIRNVRLAGGTVTAPPPSGDAPPPPPAGDSLVIMPETRVRQMGTMDEKWLLILWPVGAAWPEGEAWYGEALSYENPIDFTEWTYLTFEMLVDDFDAIPWGNDWRVRLSSTMSIDSPTFYYSFGYTVRYGGLASGAWNTIRIPIHGDRLVEMAGFDMSNVTGLRMWIEPDESYRFDARVSIRNVQLTR